MQTFCEKLGGEHAVRAVVARMYQKILDDERVSHFFADTSTEKMRHMSNEFVRIAFGGAHQYDSDFIRKAHQKPLSEGMNEQHLSIVAEHLRAALQEMQVDEALIEEGMRFVEAARKDVLCL